MNRRITTTKSTLARIALALAPLALVLASAAPKIRW